MLYKPVPLSHLFIGISNDAQNFCFQLLSLKIKKVSMRFPICFHCNGFLKGGNEHFELQIRQLS